MGILGPLAVASLVLVGLTMFWGCYRGTRAGFPPVLLSEVNFQAMFEAQQAQAKGNATNGSGVIASA